MLLHVSVTAEDIEKGDHSSHACPVALAIRRALRKSGVEADVYVTSSSGVSVYAPGGIARWQITPPEVVAWVRTYDTDKHVEPFEFDIEFDLR